jgi:hypothetical protein
MNALNNKSQTESSLTSLRSGAFKTEIDKAVENLNPALAQHA